MQTDLNENFILIYLYCEGPTLQSITQESHLSFVVQMILSTIDPAAGGCLPML